MFCNDQSKQPEPEINTPPVDEYEARLQVARKRVKEVKRFYRRVANYVFLVTLMFIIDLLDGELTWFYWVAFGLGVALAMRTYRLYSEQYLFNQEWEDRKIREIMGEKRKRGHA